MLNPDTLSTCKQVGNRIKKIREKLNLTQAQIADKVGIRFEYLVRLEQGKANPSILIVQNIAKALNVKTPDLLPF